MPLKNRTKLLKNAEGKARLKNFLALTKVWIDDFAKGKRGELIIARHLINKGFQVSPIVSWNSKDEDEIYDANQRIEQASKTIFQPDFLCANKENVFFAEAKFKEKMCWLGWVNVRDYQKYLDVMKNSGFGFHIYFAIVSTREIFVLEKLIAPSGFEMRPQSDGEVYVVPKEHLKLDGHF